MLFRSFYDNINEDYVLNAKINSSGLEHYYPVGEQTKPGYSIYPQEEYLHYFNTSNQTTIQQPALDGIDLLFSEFLTLPLMNVKYALINKRPSDYGLIRPHQ